MDNAQKTLKNSIISVVAQILTMVLQFVNRRIFIIFLDIEYLGYQSLFADVFSLLSVAELGIGNIIAFHLYKEIVNGNNDEIGKLMHLYKWLYRIIAGIVCVAGCGCYFLLPFFVKDASASWEYLHLIYFLQLASVVLGYFLSYKRTLFIATQQEYKCVQTDLFVYIFIQIIQIIALALFHNYIVYLIIQLSMTLIANYVISYKCNKQFPYIKKKYQVNKEYISSRNMFADMKNFLIHQISYAVYGGTDNIVISAFCGIRTVALYGNYTVVRKGVMQVLFYKLLNPVQATIGNVVYSDRKKEDLWDQFKMLDVFSFFFATFIGIGFLIFYQPFIQLWMGKEYLLDDSFVILMSLTIYLGAVWEIVCKYRNVFGDYKQDRGMMMLSAVLNVGVSILLAKKLGVAGVQFGTLVAFLPIAYGRIRFVVRNYFEQSMWKYIVKHMVLLLLASAEAVVCYSICKYFPVTILGLIERGIVLFLVPLIISSVVFCRNTYFKDMCKYFKRFAGIALSKAKRRNYE